MEIRRDCGNMWWICLVIIACACSGITADCDADTGPKGGIECHYFSFSYTNYQWATCLTNTYIQLVSGGTHECVDQTRTYCYYQCMLEVHGQETGSVYSDCSCSAGDTAPVTSAPLPEIPEWCYSPDGTSCTFYRECLETRYPCSDEGNSYALDFGERFCDLYEQNSADFTAVGREWINAVRKCLQVALVSLLRPFETPTCDEIKNKAFGSHAGCYVTPYDGAPSVCDIGYENWLKIWATVKPALSWDEMGQSLEIIAESAQVMWACKYDIPGEVIRITFALGDYLGDITKDMYNVVKGMMNKVKNQFNLDDLFIYPFIVDESNRKKRSVPDVQVDVLVVPRAQYDLNYNGNQDVDTSAVIDYFLDAVESDEFYPTLTSGVQLENYRVCDDNDCTNPSRVVQQPISATMPLIADRLTLVLLLAIGFIVATMIF